GGINYGNRRVLGRPTEPIPGPTALMLLALQGHPDQPRVAAAVRYLLRPAHGDDLEHLCWTKIALHAHRDQPGAAEALPGLAEAIAAAHERRQATPWVRPAPLRQALTALALGVEAANPFALPPGTPAVKAEPLAAAEPAAPRRSFTETLGVLFRGW